MYYRPSDLSLLKFLILSMIVIFPLSRPSRVILVVLDLVFQKAIASTIDEAEDPVSDRDQKQGPYQQVST